MQLVTGQSDISAAETSEQNEKLTRNQQRAEWRKRCRLSLADHINHKLGTVVDPSDVRLIPDDEDPYAWTWASDREHLFKKQLSKHSVGAYVQLCREVGISFEAVAKSDERQTPFPATTKGTDRTISIESLRLHIARLEEKTESLTQAVADREEEVRTANIAQQQLRVEIEQMSKKLFAQKETEKLLQDENMRLRATHTRSIKRLRSSHMDVGRVLTMLCQLSGELIP